MNPYEASTSSHFPLPIYSEQDLVVQVYPDW